MLVGYQVEVLGDEGEVSPWLQPAELFSSTLSPEGFALKHPKAMSTSRRCVHCLSGFPFPHGRDFPRHSMDTATLSKDSRAVTCSDSASRVSMDLKALNHPDPQGGMFKRCAFASFRVAGSCLHCVVALNQLNPTCRYF